MACSPELKRGAGAGDSTAVTARRADLDSVQREIAKTAAAVDGSVGFAAVHVESGARLSHNGRERYPMRSVYKVPIALAILRRVDAGELRRDSVVTVTAADFVPGLHSPLRERALGKSVRVSVDSLLMLMIAQSDNSASDVLLGLAGGPAAVTQHLRTLGINDVRVDRSERELGRATDGDDDPRDTASPDAMADLLVAVQQGRALSRTSHARLLEMMMRASTGPNRIRGFLPPGTRVAHKTGTGRPMTNDAGVVTLPDGGHVAIVVFVRSSAPVTKNEAIIAQIARTVYDYFS